MRMELLREYDDFFLLENLAVLERKTGLDIYDFPFRGTFDCRSILGAVEQPVLLRIGAIPDFTALVASLEEIGCRLLFSREEHDRVSLLQHWYPLLAPYTPFSRVYPSFPPLETLLMEFSFPVFIKGNRQTNHHKKSQCIILLETAVGRLWAILVAGQGLFAQQNDREPALTLAQRAADLVDVPFVSVDIAKTQRGEWIVIEVNDGQESGYAGIEQRQLWRNILLVEAGGSPVI